MIDYLINTYYDMTLIPKEAHLLEAEKMAEAIFLKGPRKQQEMIEAVRGHIMALNRKHLEMLENI